MNRYQYIKPNNMEEKIKEATFDTEFKNQVSHIIASCLNGENEYFKGFVEYCSNSLMNFAKKQIQGEIDKLTSEELFDMTRGILTIFIKENSSLDINDKEHVDTATRLLLGIVRKLYDNEIKKQYDEKANQWLAQAEKNAHREALSEVRNEMPKWRRFRRDSQLTPYFSLTDDGKQCLVYQGKYITMEDLLKLENDNEE